MTSKKAILDRQGCCGNIRNPVLLGHSGTYLARTYIFFIEKLRIFAAQEPIRKKKQQNKTS
jgi:hypothetical protein